MRRKVLFSIRITEMLIFTALAFVVIFDEQSGVTKRNAERIDIGMTQLDVQNIFGQMPSDEREHRIKENGGATLIRPDSLGKAWVGHHGIAVIEFDRNGKVTERLWIENPKSLFHKFQSWVTRQIK